MFRAIAGIDFDLDLTNPDVVLDLADQPFAFSSKFNRLSVSFGMDNPRKELPYGPGTPGKQCVGENLGLTLPIYGGTAAIMTICAQAFYRPMLDDITSPKAWAIDRREDQADGPQYYDGYGCKNLGDFDSDWLISPGALLLHELFHWPGFFEDVPGYAATIPTTFLVPGTGPGSGIADHVITDYSGSTVPTTGYGAYNTRLINELHPTFLDDQKGSITFEGIHNADNYVYYAISAYFTRECNIDFKQCPDADSAHRDRQCHSRRGGKRRRQSDQLSPLEGVQHLTRQTRLRTACMNNGKHTAFPAQAEVGSSIMTNLDHETSCPSGSLR